MSTPNTMTDRPVLLVVDDDAAVLGAVVRDLVAGFGDAYRVHRAGSGAAALRILRALRLRGEAVALVLADQRMPGMTGSELLREARRLYPEAKRVLLTAYADTDVAIRAINELRLDHYLSKPWGEPEQQLIPVLGELLADWQANAPAARRGLRLIGHPWSAESHRLRDFLIRNLAPFDWLDVEADAEAGRLLQLAGLSEAELPVLLLPDGAALSRPANLEVGRRIGLRTRAAEKVYDLIIVGAGPAGLAAAVYAASEGLSTLLVEREAPGGQAGRSGSIENYLGFPAGLSGGDLTRRAVAQAARFGAEILTPVEVTRISSRDGYHAVLLAGGQEVRSRALLITTGIAYRLLDVPGAARHAGAGVYYGAAISEGLAVRGLDVAVLGGGNSAGQAALHLARYARSVTLVMRRAGLRDLMSSYLADRIEATPAIHVRTGARITEVHGERRVEAVTLRAGAGDAADAGPGERLATAALFVFIGATARTEWLDGVVARDPQGYILAGPALMVDGRRPPGWSAPRDPFWLETSVPGIFVAGDVRHRSVKRVASAVGEGAMALQFIHQHLGGAVLRQRPQDAAQSAVAAPVPVPAGT
jgi:thioredoxin reductase (NADPH)